MQHVYYGINMSSGAKTNLQDNILSGGCQKKVH
jgi:hypothetical protein